MGISLLIRSFRLEEYRKKNTDLFVFCIGKLILCRVSGFAHKRPKGDQLDQADPVRNDDTGLWQCPFCLKSDLPELSEVGHSRSRSQ